MMARWRLALSRERSIAACTPKPTNIQSSVVASIDRIDVCSDKPAFDGATENTCPGLSHFSIVVRMIKTLTSAVEVCDREGHPDTPPIDSQRSSWKDADQMVQHLLDGDRAFRERRPSRLERLSHEMRLGRRHIQLCGPFAPARSCLGRKWSGDLIWG